MASRQQRGRFDLGDRINARGKMVIPCARCASSGGDCRLLVGYKKCGNCTRKGLSCNARDVTSSQFERVDKEKERLRLEIRKMKEIRRENDARLARFERLQESLEERELELIRRGLVSLEELDRVEEAERAASEQAATGPSASDTITMLEDFSCDIPESQWAEFLLPLNDVSIPEAASRS